MSMDAGSSVPDYVEFLLDPETPLNFHLNVGEAEERIGAVKWMLIARSKVFRTMLLDSKWKADKQVTIPDVSPDTFKHFLTFLYGHDNTKSLKIEEGVQLLNAAEKYDVADLKRKLGTAIKGQMTVDNVFVVLRDAPVCEKVPHLWEAVTKILQFHTEEVFANPQFLSVSPQVVLHIVQQECLSVPEISIWRAAVSWATHQAQPVEGVISAETLRMTVLPFLKHIRLCTLSYEELGREVITSSILTGKELSQVCLSITDHQKCESLVDVSNEIEKRGRVSLLTDKRVKSVLLGGTLGTETSKTCRFSLLTKQFPVELCAARIASNVSPSALTPKDATEECLGTVKISHMAFQGVSQPPDPPVVIDFKKDVLYNTLFDIPLRQNRGNIILKANNAYKIEFQFGTGYRKYHNRDEKSGLKKYDCFDIELNQFHLRDNTCVNGSICKMLFYKVYGE